jgi:hypothetical protein
MNDCAAAQLGRRNLIAQARKVRGKDRWKDLNHILSASPCRLSVSAPRRASLRALKMDRFSENSFTGFFGPLRMKLCQAMPPPTCYLRRAEANSLHSHKISTGILRHIFLLSNKQGTKSQHKCKKYQSLHKPQRFADHFCLSSHNIHQ